MKVLQVNVVYNKGSTGNIVYSLHHGLITAGFDSVVIYGRGDTISENNIHRVSSELYSKINNLYSRITGIAYGGCCFSTYQIIKIIKEEKPDIVHLHCINGFFVNIYSLIGWLNKNHYPTVLTQHAEFYYTANCSHSIDCEKWKTGCGSCPQLYKSTNSILFDCTAQSWKKMYRSFLGFEKIEVVSVSDWLCERSKQSSILGSFNNTTIMNGIDTSVYYYRTRNAIIEQLSATFRTLDYNKTTILHVTAFFSDRVEHIKGGYYLISLAKLMPEYQFVIVGKYSISSELPPNVIVLGEIKEQAILAALYSFSDLTVLTSRRETFSMVCAESLCCGTPVVGFKSGGPESIALEMYSSFVPFGNVEMLFEEIKRILCLPYSKNEISEISGYVYNKDRMISNYVDLYKRLLDK